MKNKREDRLIVTDTLSTETGTGHFCRLTVNKMGKVDSISYLGGEELQVESLWSLVGLSETFLNNLYVRWKDGDIPDIVDFCHQLKMEMGVQEEVKLLINRTLETLDLNNGLSREMLSKVRTQLSSDAVKQMEDRLLEYLRKN